MSIEVIDAAPDDLLTTVAYVKANLDISGSTYDTLIEQMIREASAWACKFTGRTFALEEVREKLPGKGLPELILSRTPIVSITSVKFDTSVITDYSIKDKDVGTLFRRSGWTNTNLPWNTIQPHPSSYDEDRWVIEYWGGYVLPNWGSSEGTRNFPYDLQRAVTEMVKATFLNRKMDGSLRSYKIGDTSVTWDRGAAGDSSMQGAIPNSALNVLQFYRRAF